MENMLAQYTSIDLSALKERCHFLKRKETKYLVHKKSLPTILEAFLPYYDVLTIEHKRIFSYDSCYFDTNDQRSYKQHHQGKRHRAKIRTRAYMDNDTMTYFEVKLKKGEKTFKYRKPIIRDEHGLLSSINQGFLARHYESRYQKKFTHALSAGIRIGYKRITLVHKENKERMTIDTAINFAANTGKHTLANTVILESKSDMTHAPSKYLLQQLGIKTIGPCSKYCLASIFLMQRKHNRFKQLIKRIRAIENGKTDI